MSEKRRGGRYQGKIAPSVSRDPKHLKEIGEFTAPGDEGRNRGGIVPPGGGPNSVDPRRRMFLGKQRLGKRWTEIITAVNDGVFTWDEFVDTLDDSEIARGQLKDKSGSFRGRPPAYVPRGFYDACTKRLMKRAKMEYEKAYLVAVQAFTDAAAGDMLGIKPADRLKAAQFLIERLEGKTPEKVEIKMSDPFQDMLAGALATVEEDRAIANAQDYMERMEAQDGASDA